MNSFKEENNIDNKLLIEERVHFRIGINLQIDSTIIRFCDRLPKPIRIYLINFYILFVFLCSILHIMIIYYCNILMLTYM
jgi:hypothetical protein